MLSRDCILAISTYRSGGILLAKRGHNRDIKWLVMEREIPSGIACVGNKLSVATIDKIEIYSADDIHDWFEQEESRSVRGCISKIDQAPVAIFETGKILCHEIYDSGQDVIFYVNTRYSAIGSLSEGRINHCYWMPPFITNLVSEDLCHMNGFGFSNDCPEVVTCLAGTNFPQGWRLFPANSGLLVDVKNHEIICDGLTLPHSPRIIETNIYLLQSGISCLSVFDKKSGKLQTVVELPGFARGMAIVNNYAIIGISTIRNSKLWENLPVKLKHPNSKQGIVIVDLQKEVVASYLELPSEFFEIFDIQILTR